MRIKIGHYQLECTPGDVPKNVGKVLAGLEEADREQIEIISFPESFLTGYYSTEEGARRNSLTLDGPEVTGLLRDAAGFDATFMVGFNEVRGDELRNTVIVVERGALLGTYSKAFPCFGYFTPGRDFPLFERGGVKFGVVICADGGYIEPTRILALKGARVVFAPHYNYLPKENLINHFQKVRSDHIARASENEVWFLRGNNVSSGYDEGLARDGVGYGDSYLLDPKGEMAVRSQRHVENLICARIEIDEKSSNLRRSTASGKALGKLLLQSLADIGAEPEECCCS